MSQDLASEKLVDKVVSALNKKFGDDCLKTLEDKLSESNALGFIPSNNVALDYVIGRRGLPAGRVVEIYGKSGSGKSSLVASLLGSAQASGAYAVLIDSENSYSPDWSRRYKVNPESLLLLEPEHIEEAFDYTRAIVESIREQQSSTPIFVAFDSVSATPTAAELAQEDSSASAASAEHARIISKELRKLTGLIKDQNICLCFVSQLKDNPRVTWGNTESILGGSAIKFHAALRLKLTHTKYITKDEVKIGQTIQVQATKNKFTMPYKVRTFDLFYEDGFRPKEILLDFLSDDLSMIKEKQGWYEWEGNKIRKDDMVAKLDDSYFDLAYEKLGIPK